MTQNNEMNQIFGTLGINRNLKGPVHQVTHSSDWGFVEYDHYLVHHPENDDYTMPMQPLQDGDLVTIFNTIAKGDLHWQGTISLNFERDRKQLEGARKGFEVQTVLGAVVHGLPDNMSENEWGNMFFSGMPAIVKRDGQDIHGSLEAFSEQGTEGIIWAIHEYGKKGYEGLHILKNGDDLSVFSRVTDGDIAWKGKLDFNSAATTLNGFERFNRLPNTIATESLLQASYTHNPVKIERPKP